MKILVTGSAGHLGEGVIRTLRNSAHEAVGIDIAPSPFTDHRGSVADRGFVRECMIGVDAIIHTATLHKPHIVTHSRQDFVDTNMTGTLNLLEEAVHAGAKSFVFTSTTSLFGDALVPKPGHPAVWITENVVPVPKNIYGATKAAAEDLCQLFHRNEGLPCIILRTSRFFPEADDNRKIRDARPDANTKVNEFLHRRVDIEDAVAAHLNALDHASGIGFGRYIISATTPFTRDDLADLNTDAREVVRRCVPSYAEVYRDLGWEMFPVIGRVYDNQKARNELGWRPRYDFSSVIERLAAGQDYRSPLTREIGAKGYHEEQFTDGPYPVA